MEARVEAAFVGRGHELAELERMLGATRDGSGAAVLVLGEAGIGKTRLASELAGRAVDSGCEVLLGRAIDLVGTELPYQPFVEALRPLAELPHDAAGSQLRVFEQALALLAERAESAPVVLVLEDLHWADTSTLDLLVFLAHNLAGRRILLLATARGREPGSDDRVRRLADGVRRGGAALVLELEPLAGDALRELLGARADGPLPAALADAIADRAEGNPFFAEELLAAAGADGGELPERLRDLLLQRVVRLGARTQAVLRLAAGAGRDVAYPLLRDLARLPEPELRACLREAAEGGVLAADRTANAFRFRHPLLAEAVYSTILPGEREELHARLADELARSGRASAAELAPHWAAAGRDPEAFAASLDAAREAESVFGLAEAHAHLERALALWDAVPDGAELAGADLAGLCARAAELASSTGAGPRAVELARRAIELVGTGDPRRASFLHVRLGEYLHETGKTHEGLEEFQRATEIVPAEPPSPERAYALGSLAGALMVAWRKEESLPIAEQALALAREVGAGEAEVRALAVRAGDLAYLGHAEEGLAQFREALRLAEEVDDRWNLVRVYTNLSDALMMLGRPRESAQVAQAGLDVTHAYGMHSAVLISNLVEALVAGGEWEDADAASSTALRAITANFPYMLYITRAELELWRGDFDAARAHLALAELTLREDLGMGVVDAHRAELALWEQRWTDAEQAVRDGLAYEAPPSVALIRARLHADGLRAQAELLALARARRDGASVEEHLGRARDLLDAARIDAAYGTPITPNAGAWLALAEAEHERACGIARSDLWGDAAETWQRVDRSPLSAYCRWRQAEALVAAGAPRAEASAPLREAWATATRLGARPLLHQLELLAARARLDPTPPEATPLPDERDLGAVLGLTAREAEVLDLVARGLTNREIAASLVISVKTASAHISHILRKLDAPNRREAAAIVHRVARPGP
jgi:DNA-binding CsgD family transcriptional regulator/tetratricopeptide (TPR) repeat protein